MIGSLAVLLIVAIAVAASGHSGSKSPGTKSAAAQGSTGVDTEGNRSGDDAGTTTTAPPTTTTTTALLATTTTQATLRATTTTAAPPATTASTPTTTAPVAHSCSASIANSSPADYTYDTVYIGSDVPDAPVLITKYYKTTTSMDSGQTSSGGSAAIPFDDSDATLGYTVQVDVSINNGEATCSTSFTPQ